MACEMTGMFCGRRFRENRSTCFPFLYASKRMPSNFLSKLHSGPVKRSWVSVAAMGTIHSGKETGMGEIIQQGESMECGDLSPLCFTRAKPDRSPHFKVRDPKRRRVGA